MTVLQLDIEDRPPEPIALELDRRVTLGAATEAPAGQFDRVSLGRPICRDLSPLPAELRRSGVLPDAESSTFFLLALTCSFRAVEEEPLEKAWIEVRLRAEQPPGAAAPTAWSMEPLVLQDPMTVSRTVTLDASLQLTSELVPIEIGPTAGRETKTTFEKRQPYVEAFREGTSRPSWIFTRTPATEVRGVHRLRTVIEIPAGATGQADVNVGATVKLRKFGLIPYRASLAGLPGWESVRIPNS